MKLFTGSLAAGLVLLAAGAQAQVRGPYEIGRAPYAAVSDFEGPYAAVPPGVPRYGYGPGYAGPSLLPPMEVYSVLRDNGFSPLGIPRLRGYVYTIAVIDRGGEDGRLVIDARDGRILRFVPAYRMGDRFEESRVIYGPPGARLPAPTAGLPQPGPKVAGHSVPLPKAKPLAAKPASIEPAQQAAAPLPAQVQAATPQPKAAEAQATASQPKPAEVQAAAPQAVTTGSVPARPAPEIAPTQEMPSAQGLE